MRELGNLSFYVQTSISMAFGFGICALVCANISEKNNEKKVNCYRLSVAICGGASAWVTKIIETKNLCVIITVVSAHVRSSNVWRRYVIMIKIIAHFFLSCSFTHFASHFLSILRLSTLGHWFYEFFFWAFLQRFRKEQTVGYYQWINK